MEDVENTRRPEEMDLSGKSYFLDVSLEEAETSIRASLKDAARSVIAVGHYLKVIRDKELYREAGYENVWDYAADRFGFSKSTASRYMTRNDKFSVGGNSPILAEEFRRAMRAMREGNSTKEKAQQIQKELSPYGAHCYGCSEYSFSWHSFAKGMDWEVNGKKIHLTYARLASELLCMYDPQLNQFDEKPDIDDEHEEPAEMSAEQQQEHEEKTKTGKCIHDGISRCTLSEEDKEKDGTGEDCAHHCCWNCVKRDGCNIECYASSKRKTLDDEAAAEDEENAEQPAEPIEFDRKTLEDMIRNAQEVLDQMCDYWVENQPYTYAKYNMMIQAYKLLLKEYDESNQKLDPVEQQPELPLLKNDKQRAEFIDAYEEWPLWIDNQETGEKYYRYELPDGTSFVIKTYHAMLYNYDALEYGNCKEGYGENEQYLLKPGKFFRDCRTNRSTLIDKLKELQKAGS